MFIFKNENGKNSLEINIEYPFEDFFSLVNHIKRTSNLDLVRTETKQLIDAGIQVCSYKIYYKDLNEEIGIMIKDSSYSIHFSSFITLSAVLEKEKRKELESKNIKEIRIFLNSRNETDLYEVCIENIKKYYLMESTSHLSNYQIKKILSGKRSLNYIEIRL
ncbi:hypothetical protein [Niallia sp. MER 6]|uniref:hypothetical protein n=1 Tax=Niallia sp. MER 6 TaxID=2939567 RepID=UPI00203E01AA|nr:hypothetical protein [Niallia sp. MER 6]MCM3029826.1 hypothetical protein [Niallia sp. MER 6]